MKQQLKQAGLFAILAVFTLSLTTSFVVDAEASSPQKKGDITSKPVELSTRAKNAAAAVPEPEPEAPRSESDPTRPAGQPVAPSSKAVKSAQALEKVAIKDTTPFIEEISVRDPSIRSDRDFVVTGEETEFRAVFAIVNPVNMELRNVEVQVSSDTETVMAELSGKYDEDRRSISVLIDAVDPATINAKITGFEN